jgi:hypothetical protein
MRPRRLSVALAIVAALAAHPARTQQNGEPQSRYLQVFLDRAPLGVRVAGKEGLVARVRVLELPVYLVGRDQSGAPPPLPKDLFYARVQVVQALSGTAQEGTQLEVYFGVPGPGRRYAFPRTPRQLLRDYVVVSVVGEDGLRRLQEFPLEPRDFEQWERDAREQGGTYPTR